MRQILFKDGKMRVETKEYPEGHSFRVATRKAKILGQKFYKTKKAAINAAHRYIFQHKLRTINEII